MNESTLPDYIWPAPDGSGFVDAWNGWYETEAEAREDAAGGVGSPWVLDRGENIITDDEMDERAAKALSPYERWMVRQNVEHARTEGAETVVARLRSNGYGRVANAVEKAVQS